MDFNTIGASVAAAVTSKVVFHPIDTIRTLRQTTSGSVWGLPMRTYWNGLAPSTALTVPGFTIYLVAYRQTKAWLAPRLGANSLSNYILSGSAAELASSFIWTPMEVLKGRMQIATATHSPVAGVVRAIYAKEGMRGFFRGYWMGLVVFLPHSVVWWVTYEKMKQATAKVAWFQENHSWGHATAAAAATTVAGTCTNFLDVVKTRQQLAYSDEIGNLRPDDRQGVWRVARNLIGEAGLGRALFRGLGVRLASAVPSSALAMMIVEYLQPDPVSRDYEVENKALGPIEEC